MQPRQPPICKFGDKCNKFAQGACNFSHSNQPGTGGRMGNQGMNPMGPNPNYRGPREPRDNQGQYNNYPNNNQGNLTQGGGNTSWGAQHGNYGKSFN